MHSFALVITLAFCLFTHSYAEVSSSAKLVSSDSKEYKEDKQEPGDSLSAVDSLSSDTLALASLVNDSLSLDSLAQDSTSARLVESDEERRDTSSWHLFVGGAVQFTEFTQRSYFIDEFESHRTRILAQEMSSEDSSLVRNQYQPYEQVNFAFPISLGINWHWSENHYSGIGAEWWHRRQEAMLTAPGGEQRIFAYSLQALPVFIEHRYLIPAEIATLNGADLFSIAVQYYWVLPPSYVKNNGRKAEITPQYQGNGWRIALGYEINAWKDFSFSGWLGYSSIKVNSETSWSDLLPALEESEKMDWDLGGLQMNVRLAWHWGRIKLSEEITREEIEENEEIEKKEEKEEEKEDLNPNHPKLLRTSKKEPLG
jgi:hypothetical protein